MIPDLRNQNPNPESIVLDILAKKPRLPIKELYDFFIKKYPQGMTIQGFYGLLKKLINARTLVKDGQLVSIDASWIHNLLEFGKALKKIYLKTDTTTANILLDEGEAKTFTFEKVIDMDNFWNHTLITVIHYYADHPHADKNVYNYNHHSWFQVVRTSSEQTLAQSYQHMNLKWFLVTGSNSFLDTLVTHNIDTPNFSYRQSTKGEIIKPNYYLVVIGDFLFETALPNYIFELMEKIYQNTTNLSQFNAQDIISLINQPARTTLTIFRNKKRAENLRSQIKKIFKI